MEKNKENKKNKGFTLIELLIVIAIIGILASIVLVSLSSAREKAYIATYKAQISSLRGALVVACDGADLDDTIVNGFISTTGASNRINAVAAGDVTTNCGPTGTGDFSVTTESTDLGTSAGAAICEGDGNTIINDEGVTFPVGC